MKKIQRYLSKPEGKIVAGLGLVIVLLFAYYAFFADKSASTKVADITISKTDHVRGAEAGKVTLVEFGDFQCPACGAYEPLVRQVMTDNKTSLKIVFKHFPLTQIHQNALLGAKAAEAAGLQGKFWEMHDMLYDKQAEWSTGLTARDMIMGYAATLKLDTAKFAEDLASKAIEDKILAEQTEGINLGVEGTPTFFLNGKKLDNPRSLEEFDKLVREEAAKQQ